MSEIQNFSVINYAYVYKFVCLLSFTFKSYL